MRLRKDFLTRTLKVQSIKKQVDNMDFIKIKKALAFKNTEFLFIFFKVHVRLGGNFCKI